MKDARVEAQRSQQPHAANSQHHFLHQTGLSIAAIEMSTHQAISFFIPGNVRIQQVKLHATYIGAPHPRTHNLLAHRDFNRQWISFCVINAVKRQLVRNVFAIRFFLPAIAPQALPKIAEAIEQTNRDQRRLQVIAGQYSQTP